jgi:cysteine desulfurase
MSIDLLSLSGHKLYGPKGVGALWVRSQHPAVALVPLMDGGGHERGTRSGTLNVPGIVGLGRACEIAIEEMPEESQRLGALRDRLKDSILSRLDDAHVNGSLEHRLPHNLNVSFGGVDGESLLVGLNDVALSLGSACMSATREPSYVLKALGVRDDLAQSGVRFGLGRFNTEEEVDYVVRRVVETVASLREVAGLDEVRETGEKGQGKRLIRNRKIQ